jgi:demethylspheroidene O-methyltransferase
MSELLARALPSGHREFSIGDRWFGWRNRLLASARFQHWAASFPLTRPIARRRANALFDLCAGFVYSQVLQTCVHLRLFEALRAGPLGRDQLADHLSLPADATSRLLQAATALKLVEHRAGDRFGLGPLGAAMLGNPGVAAMIEHHTLLYADLHDPLGLLRGERQGTGVGRLWPYAANTRPVDLGSDDIARYTTLMAASQPLVAEDVLDAYPIDRHRCLMDLGGGDGTFLIRVAAKAPSLKLALFDLPAVADQARTRLDHAGLTERARTFGGDFRHDPLPGDADIISLIRVIHDHNDEAALAILTAAWQALPVGGTVLIAEPMAGTPNGGGMEAYFTFYLLAMGSGRPRRTEEISALLHTAGFTRVRLVPTRRPMLVSVLVASK